MKLPNELKLTAHEISLLRSSAISIEAALPLNASLPGSRYNLTESERVAVAWVQACLDFIYRLDGDTNKEPCNVALDVPVS